MARKPSLEGGVKSFSHFCLHGAVGGFEVQHGLCRLVNTGALQSGHEHHLGGFFAQRIRFSEFRCVALCTVKVALVDQDEVGEFEQTCLLCLDAIAACRSFHNNDAVCHRSTSQLGLSSTDGFDDYPIPATTEQVCSHVAHHHGYRADGLSRRHRADVHSVA